jgi:adenosylmethionine-8-amino-7-oxononanoate aminotransferase
MELTEWSLGEQYKNVIGTHKYWIEYSNGETHLDIQSGNTAYILGYGDDEILDDMHQTKINFIRHNSGESCSENDELVNFICKTGNWSGLAWAVSGSDAVEAAIAMNDLYWQIKNPKKTKIISFSPGYHGTTVITKHLCGQYSYLGRSSIIEGPNWRNSDEQFEQEDIALKKVRERLETDPTIGCIIMETIPWIGNLTPYSKNWWQSIRSLCDEFDVLMLVDDVALCWGKNGTLFGWEPYGVQPDISSLGKSLTAGYSPLGASVCNKKVFNTIGMRSWNHGHTWSPSMQGISAALTATKKINSLLHRVPYINQELCKIANELGLNSRGKNLFMCFDLPREVSIADLSRVKLAATLPGHKCVKLFPPIIADEEYFQTLKTRLKKLQ